MAAVTVYSDSEAQENNICHSFHFFPFDLLWRNGTRCLFFFFFNVEFQAGFFTSLFHPYQEAVLVPLHFLPLCGIVCISEVVDIFPGKLVIHLLWQFIRCTLYRSWISRWHYTALILYFASFEPVYCSMSGSNMIFINSH